MQFLPRFKQPSAWQVNKESKALDPVEFARANAVRRSNCKAADKAGFRRAGVKIEAGESGGAAGFFCQLYCRRKPTYSLGYFIVSLKKLNYVEKLLI
ncbi:MAG: hypothetical protein HY842_09505 [Bacteroidetes bacterium]|nr:hypothetical protein [Bacteroidota bacterium]